MSDGWAPFRISRQRTSAGGAPSRKSSRAAACQLSKVGSISTDLTGTARTSPLAIATEKTVLGPSVRMKVIGDVAHVTIDPELAELSGRDLGEAGVHVGHVRGGRRDAVKAPHHHRCLADLALGNPADVVLEEPGRELQSPAEIAILYLRELGPGRRRCAHGSYPTSFHATSPRRQPSPRPGAPQLAGPRRPWCYDLR